MQLKEGERVLKKDVMCGLGTLFLSVLYLTNQRLVWDKYSWGIFKRTVGEIPLTDIKNVEDMGVSPVKRFSRSRASIGSFKIEYMQHGKPATITFIIQIYERLDDDSHVRQKSGDDWISQIQKAANLDVTKKPKQFK